ncbi:MAG TPA: hypothetical protein PLH94_13880 [Fimbriimonadaceae bacterium]|nr:hypothetical protein [Fimbriimonadaceae bacterium]
MKSLIAIVMLTSVAVQLQAQPHKLLAASSAVVVAETVAVEGGLYGTDWRHPESSPRKFARFTLRVITVIKGDAIPDEFAVAVPDAFIEDHVRGPKYFSRKIGLKALWYLQSNREGKFKDDDGMRWQVPGVTHSTLSWFGYQTDLLETQFRRSDDPLLEIADLLAVNWARRPRGYGTYVEQVRRIDPIGLAGYRGTPLLPDNPQRARLMEWLDRRLPEILGERSAEDLLNEYSLRLSWGQDEYSKRFTDLYLSDPRSLKCALPAYLDLVDLLRIFMASERALCAQLAASLPKTMPAEDRVRVTRKVLDFLAIDRTYDVPFLNALADWWSRPDLSPLEHGKPKPDLTPLIEQARRLLDR